MTEFDILCRSSSDKQTCINNVLNMRAVIRPFDYYATVLQGIHIRDRIDVGKIMQTIFIDNFGFDFKFIETKGKFGSWTDMQDDTEAARQNLENQLYTDVIKNLNEDKLYFVNFYVPKHVNLHFIDQRKQPYTVYVYEPHVPTEEEESAGQPYWYMGAIKNMYRSEGYIIKDLPYTIFKQRDLPLCYVYVIHYFLYLFLSVGRELELQKYIQECDNLYIMKFTRDLLKLCYSYGSYGLVDSVSYYLLTNNTYQMQLLKVPVIYDVLKKVNSETMIDIIYLNIGFFDIELKNYFQGVEKDIKYSNIKMLNYLERKIDALPDTPYKHRVKWNILLFRSYNLDNSLYDIDEIKKIPLPSLIDWYYDNFTPVVFYLMNLLKRQDPLIQYLLEASRESLNKIKDIQRDTLLISAVKRAVKSTDKEEKKEAVSNVANVLNLGIDEQEIEKALKLAENDPQTKTVLLNYTGLLSAVLRGDIKRTQELLRTQSPNNIKDYNNTPLLFLSIKHPDIFNELLNYPNIDLTVKNSFSENLPMAIIQSANKNIRKEQLQYLIKNKNIFKILDINYYYVTTVLFLACEEKNPDIELINMILDSNPNPNLGDAFNMRPLMSLLKRFGKNVNSERLNLIKRFMDMKADLNATDDYEKNTPFLYAVMYSSVDTIRVLTKYKINYNHQNANGDTALLLACKKGAAFDDINDSTEIIYIICSTKEGLESAKLKDNNGNPPLYYAVVYSLWNVFDKLIVDLTLSTEVLLKIIDYESASTIESLLDSMKKILGAGYKINTNILTAAINANRPDIVKLLLEEKSISSDVLGKAIKETDPQSEIGHMLRQRQKQVGGFAKRYRLKKVE
jgi:ankyrin repeat protein